MIMNVFRHIDRTKVQFDFVENTDQVAAYDEEIQQLGGRVFRCPHYNGLNHAKYVRWWNRFFLEHAGEYAAVHGHLGSTASIYLSAAKKYGVYTIAHSHNTNGVGFKHSLYRMYSFPTRYIADYFFACSQAAGNDRFGKKVASDPSRFRVINNAIDTGLFGFQPQVRGLMREKLHVAEGEILIGHVGRFVEQKNHLFLVDIFSEIYKMEPKAKMLLIGQEDPEEKVRKKVESLGLSERVIFAGVQDHPERFYQAMDVFVFPSLFEGLGMVAVEAQTSGLPCVISDTVSEECILANDLVVVRSLEDSPSLWAESALAHVRDERTDHSVTVAAKGYDVHDTALWLTDFYCTRVK